MTLPPPYSQIRILNSQTKDVWKSRRFEELFIEKLDFEDENLVDYNWGPIFDSDPEVGETNQESKEPPKLLSQDQQGNSLSIICDYNMQDKLPESSLAPGNNIQEKQIRSAGAEVQI